MEQFLWEDKSESRVSNIFRIYVKRISRRSIERHNFDKGIHNFLYGELLLVGRD